MSTMDSFRIRFSRSGSLLRFGMVVWLGFLQTKTRITHNPAKRQRYEFQPRTIQSFETAFYVGSERA